MDGQGVVSQRVPGVKVAYEGEGVVSVGWRGFCRDRAVAQHDDVDRSRTAPQASLHVFERRSSVQSDSLVR
jgi:hypothetical protein